MPDINLLNDTRSTTNGSSSAKKAAPSPVQYSKVDDSKKGEHPLVKPSGPSLWLRSLFTKKPKGAPLPKKPVAPVIPKMGAEVKKDPNDIFADLDMPETVLVKRPVPESPRPVTPPTVHLEQPPARSSSVTPTPRPVPPVVSQPAVEGGPLRMPSQPPRIPPIANRPVTPTPQPSRIPPVTPGAPMQKPTIPPLPPQKRAAGKKKEKEETNETGEFGVNLLPEEFVTSYNPRKKLITAGLVTLAAILAVGIVDVSLLLYKETQVKKTDEKNVEVATVVAKIKNLETDQKAAIAFKAQNDVLRQLLNRHVYWTQFLNKFQQYTIPSVFYPSGISLDLGGVVTMTGIAPDLSTVLQQLAVYQGATDLVTSANINTVTHNTKNSTYSFVIDFTFNPAVFYRPLDTNTTTTTK